MAPKESTINTPILNLKDTEPLLPCLQAAGSWWTSVDRRQLFSYLLMIFPFECSYLSSLPAARYQMDGQSYTISPEDIKRDAANTLRYKCSCNAIRQLSFSFGKLNPRLCYLCPYNSTYKNKEQERERLLLAYVLDTQTSLSAFLLDENKKMEDVFCSHYPIYAGNTLVDAFPLSILSHGIDALLDIRYLDDPKTFRKEFTSQMRTAALQKIKYQRRKEDFYRESRDYEAQVLSCIQNEFNAVEQLLETLPKTGSSIPKLQHLARSLMAKRTYFPKKPEEYQYPGKELLTPEFPFLSESEKGTGKETISLNALEDLEAQSLKKLPSYDDTANITHTFFPAPSKKETAEQKASEYQNKENHPKQAEKVPVENETPPIHPSFPDFFELPASGEGEWFFFCLDNLLQNRELLNALFQETTFLCMEPAHIDREEGILLMNDQKDFLFYPIKAYGATPIRKLVDTKIPVYTSNNYSLCRYLHKVQVRCPRLFDLCLAESMKQERPVTLFTLIPNGSLQTAMEQYAHLYGNTQKALSKEKQARLQRYETFIPLLSSNGKQPPFSGIEKIFEQKDSLTFVSSYKKKNIPLQCGTFLYATAVVPSGNLTDSQWLDAYMDALIDYDRYIPLTGNQAYLLSIGAFGIFLFLSGNQIERIQMPQYLKASIRRTFACYAAKDAPVKISLQSVPYHL